jgi:hypothetical protein
MSRPSSSELAPLNRIADDLFEVFSARGHRVQQALDVDPSFGSGMSRAYLTRDLVIDSINRSSSQNCVRFDAVNGAGRELLSTEDGVLRRYRVLRGRRDGNGELVVTVNSASAFASNEDLGDLLLRQEKWVLSWVASADGQILEVIVSEVEGYIEGRPGRLLLGQGLALGNFMPPKPGSFVPVDEDLDLVDDEDLRDDDEDLGEDGVETA